jgi:phospholipase/carboxylesterase
MPETSESLRSPSANKRVDLNGPVILPTSGIVKRLVIIFHGYGADGENLIDLGYAWQSLLPETAFIAPNAPTPCELGGGGWQWFSLEEKTTELVQERLKSVQDMVCSYIKGQAEKYNVDLRDVVLVGFSQGAMLAIHQAVYALRHCAGVVAFSGGFTVDEDLDQKGFPKVLLCHGEADQVVPVDFSRQGYADLKTLRAQPQLLTSPKVGHEINEEAFKTAGLFLKDLIQ